MEQLYIRGSMIAASKEHKRQDKQQYSIKTTSITYDQKTK